MFIHFEWIIICPVHTYGFMKKLKFLFFPTILVLAFGLMLSCAKSSEDNINSGVAKFGDTLGGGGSGGSGGDASYSCSFKNTKAFIVGNAVTEKCIFYDCPKSKIVVWDLNGCMKVVGESVLGAVDAAFYNNSIYIADDAGFYWIV